MRRDIRKWGWAGGAGVAAACALGGTLAIASPGHRARAAQAGSTATPIKHLVVIFQENVSFDHYFGTYPIAANPAGQPAFTPAPGTPSVNGLNQELLSDNPNTGGDGQPANPQRLDRSQPLTCDQGHGYKQEQQAFDSGLMDKFVQFTNTETCAPPDIGRKNLVMDYYDGNTTTALWNYAQRFAMSDNSFSTTFGPSTPGALNLVSGQTHGDVIADSAGNSANGTVIGDPQPVGDACDSPTRQKAHMQASNKNIGDLLNARNVTWGWFAGGFRPADSGTGAVDCAHQTANVGGKLITDYIAHHEPFQYYASTANPQHLPPSSDAEIGHGGQANHQYDLSLFDTALREDNLPAVSFVKAIAAQDGHAGYSGPLDEQKFIVDTVNKLQRSKDWQSTAVIIAYDDSDGWYDHQMSPIVNHSSDPANDALAGPGLCGALRSAGAYQDRCGYGPRQPLLVISPLARSNYVDHAISDQSSILRLVEDNWHTGQIGDQSFDAKAGSLLSMFDFSHQADDGHRLFLDPQTGEPINGGEGNGDQQGNTSP